MKTSPLVLKTLAGLVLLIALTSTAHAATAMTYAAAQLVDSDGDGVPDLLSGNSFDNAPGIFNPSQADIDADQYGDVIDPNSSVFGPVVDIEFTVGGTYTVAPGAGVTINFTTIASPPGDFGHINLYLQPGGTPDAFAFQSLAAPGGSFFIPANLVTIPGFWDLNTVGTYNVEVWGLAPGPIAGYKGGIATVNVVPEPSSIAMGISGLLAAIGLFCRPRLASYLWRAC